MLIDEADIEVIHRNTMIFLLNYYYLIISYTTYSIFIIRISKTYMRIRMRVCMISMYQYARCRNRTFITGKQAKCVIRNRSITETRPPQHRK